MDDDDKVRRNLMVLSALIAAYFWLDLPPSAVSDRILGAGQGVRIEPWKIWSAILAMLVYQLYRFWTTARESDGWRQATAHWRAFLAEGLRRVVTSSVEEDERKARNFRLLVKDETVNAEMFTRSGPQHAGSNTCSLDGWWSQAHEDPWTQLATIGRRPGKNGAIHVSGWRIRVPWYRKWWFELALAFPRYAATRHLAEFSVPILLGYVALCLCVNRLMRELL